MIEDYLTAVEAGELIGRGKNMIAKLCQAGRLPGAKKVGLNWLIPRESVLAYKPGRRGRKSNREQDAALLSSAIDAAKGQADK